MTFIHEKEVINIMASVSKSRGYTIKWYPLIKEACAQFGQLLFTYSNLSNAALTKKILEQMKSSLIEYRNLTIITINSARIVMTMSDARGLYFPMWIKSCRPFLIFIAALKRLTNMEFRHSNSLFKMSISLNGSKSFCLGLIKTAKI